jgi:hypothetical protein
MAMQGDLDENDEEAVAEARTLIDRAQRALPRSLEDDVAPMLDLMERGIRAAEEGEDPNEVIESDETSLDDVMGAAEAIRDYQQEECDVTPEGESP